MRELRSLAPVAGPLGIGGVQPCMITGKALGAGEAYVVRGGFGWSGFGVVA